MKAPFPWFGGKRRVAHVVWSRLGADAPSYAEPFAGSLAVLLGRPGGAPEIGVETVNDKDGFVANAWRAIAADPEQVAHHADWPVNENDLHARHAWLVERRAELVSRLEGDPDYHDAKIAGWWLWGISCWIGSGWCSSSGPWHRVEVAPGDWRLVRGNAGQGVNRTRVHLGNAGQGVNRQLVHLGDAGRGVKQQLVHLGGAGRGVAGDGECGLVEWMLALAERLRRVRVCCGDWARIVTYSALVPAIPGPRAIFLDPPYSAEAGRSMGCYGANDDGSVAHDVREWAREAGRDPSYRIALCGYEGEHNDLEREGWSVFAWSAPGGMSKNRGKGSGGNNDRERIWFSPGCLAGSPAQRQGSLFTAPLNDRGTLAAPDGGGGSSHDKEGA